MRLRETAMEEFISAVREKNQKIVIYGAGVIGKMVVPFFMEEQHLTDRVLFVVDADIHKHGTQIQIGKKNIQVSPPARLNHTDGDSAILITSSRYETILMYLKKIESLSEADVYIFPQMMAKECHFGESQGIRRRTEKPMIPKVFHYCWFGRGKMPDRLKRYMESWNRFCPEYQIVEWNEDNYDVDKHIFTRQAYQHKKWAFVSDIAKIEILYQNGGIYLDTDVELIRSLDELLYQPGFVGVEKWGIANMGGGCGAVQGHPMLKKMLEYRLSFEFEHRDGSLNLESSGSYETKPLLDYGFRPNNTVQVVNDMTVYTSDYFHPFDYMSKELCVTANTYGIHHFAESWV